MSVYEPIQPGGNPTPYEIEARATSGEAFPVSVTVGDLPSDEELHFVLVLPMKAQEPGPGYI
jgi:hypothetical protein